MAENHVVITNEKTLPLVFSGRLYAHTNTRKCVYIHMYIYKFQIEFVKHLLTLEFMKTITQLNSN